VGMARFGYVRNRLGGAMVANNVHRAPGSGRFTSLVSCPRVAKRRRCPFSQALVRPTCYYPASLKMMGCHTFRSRSEATTHPLSFWNWRVMGAVVVWLAGILPFDCRAGVRPRILQHGGRSRTMESHEEESPAIRRSAAGHLEAKRGKVEQQAHRKAAQREWFAFVYRRNADFAPHSNVGAFQLTARCGSVERLQQSRTAMPMNLNRQSNDTFGQFPMP
jgi:hypothetical protein